MWRGAPDPGRLIIWTTGLTLFAGAAFAQEGLIPADGASLAGRAVQLIAVITLLGLVPGLAVTVTCFPFIVTVLSILRQAIGLQQAPPNMLMVTLALFLSWFVMDPVLTQHGKPESARSPAGKRQWRQHFPISLVRFRVSWPSA